jgi:hypothetical protein
MFVLTKVDVSNIHDEKFGRPQRSQFQDTLCKPLYNDTHLRVLVINWQSIENKKYDLENLTESTKPDIIIGKWVMVA